MLYTSNVNGFVTEAEFTHDQSIKKKTNKLLKFFSI